MRNKAVLFSLFCAGIYLAGAVHAETVYSTPVGFQRINLEEGRNFVGVSLRQDSPTLISVLGTNQLPTGTTVSVSTTLDIWNQDEQALTNRYWASSAPGFEGWSVSPSFAAANSLPLDTDKGLILTIRSGEGTQELILSGNVTIGTQDKVLFENGYTLVASMFPAEVDLDQSGLITSGFIGGFSLAQSDNLIFYNHATDQFDDKIWYDSVGGVWRHADASLATRKLQAGESFLIRRRNRGAAMTWSHPLPYTLP